MRISMPLNSSSVVTVAPEHLLDADDEGRALVTSVAQAFGAKVYGLPAPADHGEADAPGLGLGLRAAEDRTGTGKGELPQALPALLVPAAGRVAAVDRRISGVHRKREVQRRDVAAPLQNLRHLRQRVTTPIKQM